MGIRLQGMITPRISIFDLGIEVFKDQVVEITSAQYGSSLNCRQYVGSGALKVVGDAVTARPVPKSYNNQPKGTSMNAPKLSSKPFIPTEVKSSTGSPVVINDLGGLHIGEEKVNLFSKFSYAQLKASKNLAGALKNKLIVSATAEPAL